jgi:hypothetical protein
MNKRLCVLVSLFFAVSFGLFGQGGGGKVIEHIVWADTLRENALGLTIAEYPNKAEFESLPFLTFNVPESPKSTAIFFETRGHALVEWSNLLIDTTEAVCWINLRIISNLIPENIEVGTGAMVVRQVEKNSLPFEDTIRSWDSRRYVLRKGDVDLWVVRNIASGEVLPEIDAKAILKKLIENGFKVEVWANGTVQGVKSVWIMANVHVTRIS